MLNVSKLSSLESFECERGLRLTYTLDVFDCEMVLCWKAH